MQPSLDNLTQSICSACGYPNTPGEMFCQHCGVQLAPVASVPPPPPRPVIPGQPDLPPAVTSPAASPGKLVLKATQAEIPLPGGKNEILIGRSDPVRELYPEVDLSLHGGDQAGVSRLHARLALQAGQWMIEDLNSTNYSYLNGQRLQPGQWYPLHPGDQLRLGLLDFLVVIG